MRTVLLFLVLTLGFGAAGEENAADSGEPSVVIRTNFGDITVSLDDKKAPITVANFLRYVDDGSYENTIFHRVIEDFMIQGGGYYEDLSEVPEGDLIYNEAENGLKNRTGTVAMARSDAIDSAGRQFFINTKNNNSLNHSARSCTRAMEAKFERLREQGRYRPQTCKSFGYAVFGRVIDGMDVVELIEQMETDIVDDFDDLPVVPVIIRSIERRESLAP